MPDLAIYAVLLRLAWSPLPRLVTPTRRLCQYLNRGDSLLLVSKAATIFWGEMSWRYEGSSVWVFLLENYWLSTCSVLPIVPPRSPWIRGVHSFVTFFILKASSNDASKAWFGIAHPYPKVLAVKPRIVRKWRCFKREWTKSFH